MNLRKIIFFSLFLATFSGCQHKDDSVEVAEYKNELSGYAKEYITHLKTVLVKNLKEGGAGQAAAVCSDTASVMTNSFSETKGVTIKRFSFKNRNGNNYPDTYEISVLQKFEKMIETGELDDNSYILELNQAESGNAVVFSRPIFVGPPCLNCHGNNDQISDDVKLILSEKYPEDKAKGYKIGDLRGAISVTKGI